MTAQGHDVVDAGLHLGCPPERPFRVALKPLVLVQPASPERLYYVVREEAQMTNKTRPCLTRFESVTPRRVVYVGLEGGRALEELASRTLLLGDSLYRATDTVVEPPRGNRSSARSGYSSLFRARNIKVSSPTLSSALKYLVPPSPF
eukprot:4725431-Prymnesium_polylepis.1